MLARLNATTGIPLNRANRHGLITGPTGTGKTVTLMRLAEQFVSQGVPVFVSDVKGDLSALARSCPVNLVDLFGMSGRQIHLTFDAMGADLVSRALELSDAQSGTIEIAFAYARDNGLALATIADLRQVLSCLARNRGPVQVRYGQASNASLAVVLRSLLRLEAQGAIPCFAAPAFDVASLLEPRVTILAADRLMQSPRLYGATLLFILEQLYQRLPEAGDLDRPRLVLFFDEAHLLFHDMAPALLRRIEQTVRLIRSKGVGIYLASQSRDDVPALIREQLATRIEHDRTLPIGTVRFQTLNAKAVQVRVTPPACPLGPLSNEERQSHVPSSEPVSRAPAGGMDWQGYAFLCFVLTVLGALAWVWDTGRVGLFIAGLLGTWLALRKRLHLT
jgi:DNA helicase HerA-like ATPase